MSERLYSDCVETAMALYLRALGFARGMRLNRSCEYEYVTSDNKKGPNKVFSLYMPEENFQHHLEELINKIKAGDVPNNLLITSKTQPQNLLKRLEENDFEINDNGLCMVCDLANFKNDKTENGIATLKVSSQYELKDWVAIVNSTLLEEEILSFDQFEDIFNLKSTQFYLCLYNGIPASACLTISEGVFADLNLVATLANYKRKGLATAVISKALSELKTSGIKTVSVQEDVHGIQLYKKLGFKEHCRRITAKYKLTVD